MKPKLLPSLVAAALPLLAACSLLVERGAEQCATTADCQALGPAFRGAVCGAQKTCVLGAGLDGGDGGVLGADCNTNQDCITKAGGTAAICRKDTKKCVPVLNVDCDSVRSFTTAGGTVEGADAVRDDETVLIGVLQSLRGPNQPKGLARVQAVELAVAEVMTRAAGLPPAQGSDKRRPVAVVACNDIEEANPPPAEPAVVRSSKHLFELGVPAVVGAGNSGNTIAATPHLAKKGVFLIAPSATTPSITTADDDGLLWRTAPSDALQAIPLADRVNAALALTGKLAILYKADAYGQGLFEQAAKVIQINGKPMSDPANAQNVLARQYDPSAADHSTLVAEVLPFKPTVIAIVGTSEGVSGLMAPIEQGWVAGTQSAPRPNYVVSDGLKAGVLTDLIAADEKGGLPGTNLRRRVVGTAPGRPNATTRSFFLRFEPKYGNSNSAAFGTAGAYDSAYVILYGLAATAAKAPTGKSIVEGVGKLVSAPTGTEVGPADLNDALQKLTAGASIDLNGASSPLKFDLNTGESPADIEVWCVPPAARVPTPTFTSTDLYYDATSEGMLGTFACE